MTKHIRCATSLTDPFIVIWSNCLYAVTSAFFVCRTLGLQSLEANVHQWHHTFPGTTASLGTREMINWAKQKCPSSPKRVNLHLPKWPRVDIHRSWPCSLVPKAPEVSNNIVCVSGATPEIIHPSQSAVPINLGWQNATHAQHKQSCAQKNKLCWILTGSVGTCAQ